MTNNSTTNGRYAINDFKEIKEKVLNWVQQFNTFSFLDNHQYQVEPHSMECLLAAGVKRFIKADAGMALQQLQTFIDEQGCWLFGHLGYDLKNEIEPLRSAKESGIQFPDLFFFEPEIVIRITIEEIII